MPDQILLILLTYILFYSYIHLFLIQLCPINILYMYNINKPGERWVKRNKSHKNVSRIFITYALLLLQQHLNAIILNEGMNMHVWV